MVDEWTPLLDQARVGGVQEYLHTLKVKVQTKVSTASIQNIYIYLKKYFPNYTTSNIRHKDFYPFFVHASGSSDPPRILKQGGLESSGRRLIPFIGQTKILGFFLSLFCNFSSFFSSKLEKKKETNKKVSSRFFKIFFLILTFNLIF